MLRFFSGNPFLQSQCVKYKLGEFVPAADGGPAVFKWSLAPTKYATTIHAINSCVIKLSKLTKATSVYRGVAGMRLPPSFFELNEDGVAGGVEVAAEAMRPARARRLGCRRHLAPTPAALRLGPPQFGFSSTTCKRGTAEFYAKVGKAEAASTLLEATMGLVDRGADISFGSQFPGCALQAARRRPAPAMRL